MYKIVVPYVPKSGNVYNNMHYMSKHRYKKKIENDVYYLIRQQKQLPKEPIKYAKLRFTYVFKTHRRRDLVDNFSPKILMDALVKGSVLVDDRTDYVGVPELCERFDKGKEYTIIEVWEDCVYDKKG